MKAAHLHVCLMGNATMDNRVIGFTASTFDLLHAGHISMLREAKAKCDYLICGLQVDPSLDRPKKNKPVQTLVERYTQLLAVSYVDEIIPYESETESEAESCSDSNSESDSDSDDEDSEEEEIFKLGKSGGGIFDILLSSIV